MTPQDSSSQLVHSTSSDSSVHQEQLDSEIHELFDLIVSTVTHYVPQGVDIRLRELKIDFSQCEVLNADNWLDHVIARSTDMAHAFSDSEPLIYDDLFLRGSIDLGMFFFRYMRNHRNLPITFHCYMTRDGRDVLFTREAHNYLHDFQCYDFECGSPQASPDSLSSDDNRKGCLFGKLLSAFGNFLFIRDIFTKD